MMYYSPLSLVSSVSLKFGSLGPQAVRIVSLLVSRIRAFTIYFRFVTNIDPCFRNVRLCAAEADAADTVAAPSTVTSCRRRPCRAIS